jgi:glutamine synthetase
VCRAANACADHELLPIYEYGRFLPGSILVVDTLGADCEETGLVWEDGDADRVARPVPGTLIPAPWLGDDVGPGHAVAL